MTLVTINGERLTAIKLHVPGEGAWTAECDLELAPAIGPRVTIKLGASVLSGTIVDEQAGEFGQQRKVRIVGGAGGWRNEIVARAYHNDAGVKARLVAEDVAREVGEVLGTFVPSSERVGKDYVRNTVAASRVLEDVSGEAVPWFVGFDGRTNVGQRPTAPAIIPDDYQVIAFDPRSHVLTLSVSDPSVIQVGSVIAGPSLAEAQTIREYEVQISSESARIVAWTGSVDGSAGRLADLWRALTNRVSVDSLSGLYRYRVVSMAADGRVSLQSVRKAAGLPDIEPISQWPGVAGVHSVLSPGAEVLVAFVEGDRSQPVLTHYAGKDGPGFVPISLTLGGSDGLPAARQNDTVEVLLPPALFTGTIGGAPVTGVITFPLMTTLGQITTGSSKVRVVT